MLATSNIILINFIITCYSSKYHDSPFFISPNFYPLYKGTIRYKWQQQPPLELQHILLSLFSRHPHLHLSPLSKTLDPYPIWVSFHFLQTPCCFLLQEANVWLTLSLRPLLASLILPKSTIPRFIFIIISIIFLDSCSVITIFFIIVHRTR